jgi:type I restriction enzyme S subunit
MKTEWSLVKLGETLRRSEEAIEPKPNAEYSEITVRLWGKGVIERGRIAGTEVLGRRYVARTGQFIASRIDARNGAMGLVPESLEGALVTNDFPLFNINTERLEPAFLGWLCRTAEFVDLCLRASEGTTNRVRLKEDRFLALEIPLPSLAEQRRVVARIERLAAQINEAGSLRHQAAKEAEGILAAYMRQLFNFDIAETIIGDFAKVQGGFAFTSTDYDENGTHQVVRIGNVRDGYLDLSRAPVRWTPGNDTRTLKYELQPGDLLISMTGTRQKRDYGFIAEVPEGYRLLLNQRVGRFRIQKEINREYLFYFLRSPFFRDRLFPSATGTANQANIGNDAIEQIKFSPPPLHAQRRIVTELNALQAEVDALKRLQAETTAQLNAMLPAILDRAFNGEL